MGEKQRFSHLVPCQGGTTGIQADGHASWHNKLVALVDIRLLTVTAHSTIYDEPRTNHGGGFVGKMMNSISWLTERLSAFQLRS